jgi:DNA-binding response OmpR family regulator
MASILIVEDEELVGRMMVLNLRGEGHEVAWIKSAEEIDAAMKDRACDLIIMDVMLPGRDGMSATQALRDRGFCGPILMVTARDQVTDRVKGLKAGADDYLAKPFRLEELLARVQVLIKRSKS